MRTIKTPSPALTHLNTFCQNPTQMPSGDLLYTQPIHAWTSTYGPGTDHDERLRLTEFRADELRTTVTQLFDAATDEVELLTSGSRGHTWKSPASENTRRRVDIWLTPSGEYEEGKSPYNVNLFQQTNQVRYEMLTTGDAIIMGGLMCIAAPGDVCRYFGRDFAKGGWEAMIASLKSFAAEVWNVPEESISVENSDHKLTVLKLADGRFLSADKLKTNGDSVYRIDIASEKRVSPEQALKFSGRTQAFLDFLRIRHFEMDRVRLPYSGKAAAAISRYLR